MRNRKRFLSCLLAASMVLTSMSPMAVMAETADTTLLSESEDSENWGGIEGDDGLITEDTSDDISNNTSEDNSAYTSADDAAEEGTEEEASDEDAYAYEAEDQFTDSQSVDAEDEISDGESEDGIEENETPDESGDISYAVNTDSQSVSTDPAYAEEGTDGENGSEDYVITVDNENVTWEQAVESANAATENVTIKLAADVASVKAETTLGNADAAIKLDLNGKTLTVKDPDSNNMGKLTADKGKLTIGGGTVIGGESCISVNGADLVVTDGIYSAYGYCIMMQQGTLEICDGTFSGNYCGFVSMGGETTLRGGVYQSKYNNAAFSMAPVVIAAGTVSYADGYFLSETSAETNEDGYYTAFVSLNKGE